MNRKRRPIHRSILMSVAVFIFALCILLSAVMYLLISNALYKQFNERLDDVLRYVAAHADKDDLAACAGTGEHSQEYDELQEFLNGMIDELSIEYLYIVIPDSERGVMINVISATSAEEFAAGEDNMALLEETDSYDQKTLRQFETAMGLEENSHFVEESGYGAFYTACMPLADSTGNVFALACADMSISDLYSAVASYVLISMVIIVVSGILFGWILVRRLKKNVSGPITELEKSTRHFSETNHDIMDPDFLRYDAPKIRANNEIKSLSEAITQMSRDMKIYVTNILTAEDRATSAEAEARDMTKIAFQDPLTQVKSKAAYDRDMAALADRLKTTPGKFAILMVDLNDLKFINDHYGHESGDKYILGSSRIISNIYKHSPVYRVGGDEFVVLIMGEDYDNRTERFEQLRDSFERCRRDEARNPWERYGAGIGMSDYSGDPEETPYEVFNRADEAMYRFKEEVKSGDGGMLG